MTPDLTGMLVRWESDGQWLTARIHGAGTDTDIPETEVTP